MSVSVAWSHIFKRSKWADTNTRNTKASNCKLLNVLMINFARLNRPRLLSYELPIKDIFMKFPGGCGFMRQISSVHWSWLLYTSESGLLLRWRLTLSCREYRLKIKVWCTLTCTQTTILICLIKKKDVSGIKNEHLLLHLLPPRAQECCLWKLLLITTIISRQSWTIMRFAIFYIRLLFLCICVRDNRVCPSWALFDSLIYILLNPKILILL